MLRPSFGKPASRIEQILHDDGLFLGRNHALPNLCVHFHHRQIHSD